VDAVYWFEQTGRDVPPGNDWMSPAERSRQDGLRFPKRQTEWRLGRWTAKLAVAACMKLAVDPRALAVIEILARESGAPAAFHLGQPAPVAISISHRAGQAACAVAPPGSLVGCDLELIEQRDDVFVADYFTAAEQAAVFAAPEADRDALVTVIWSAKESALKAIGEGLRLDTHDVEVSVGASGDDWVPIRVKVSGHPDFSGWWSTGSQFVRTVVVSPLLGIRPLSETITEPRA
jgi:4'-phosphopantetheinyl transferase